MSAETSSSVCGVRSCGSPAAGSGIFGSMQLCQAHFDRDVARLTQRKGNLVKKLSTLLNSTDRVQLRLEHSALQAELEEATDMFDAVQEALQLWRQRTLSRVQAVLDSVAGRITDAAEAEQVEKDVATACDAGDMRRLAELTMSAELWLEEATERSEEFDEARSKLRDRQSSVKQGLAGNVIVRSVGDVATGVQELQYIINRHMTSVLQHCWLDDSVQTATDLSVFCSPKASHKIDNLDSAPCHMTCCSNSVGFSADSSGFIVKAATVDSDSNRLPSPCLIVSHSAFSEETISHLLVTSLDGAVRLKYRTDLNWSEWISGLHYDDARQWLFVAQLFSVTVTDLSGELKRTINAELLNQSSLRITAIDGNTDKIYILNRALKNVLIISKESGKLQSAIDVSCFETGGLDELSLHGSKVLLLNFHNGLVHKVCSITGQLLARYPAPSAGQDFVCPGQAVADGSGLVLVSEQDGQFIRVLSGTVGSILQTLTVADLQPSNKKQRFSLILVQFGGTSTLVVANEGKKALIVYNIVK